MQDFVGHHEHKSEDQRLLKPGLELEGGVMESEPTQHREHEREHDGEEVPYMPETMNPSATIGIDETLEHRSCRAQYPMEKDS